MEGAQVMDAPVITRLEDTCYVDEMAEVKEGTVAGKATRKRARKPCLANVPIVKNESQENPKNFVRSTTVC